MNIELALIKFVKSYIKHNPDDNGQEYNGDQANLVETFSYSFVEHIHPKIFEKNITIASKYLDQLQNLNNGRMINKMTLPENDKKKLKKTIGNMKRKIVFELKKIEKIEKIEKNEKNRI